MRRGKASKIDPALSYPCPCHRRGQLCPITLTEAFGCHQCQHIFVVRGDGYVLEQLSGLAHTRRWYWTGKVWNLIRPPVFRRGLWVVSALAAFVLLLFLGLAITLPIPVTPRIMVWIVLTIVMLLGLSFVLWLTTYRSF